MQANYLRTDASPGRWPSESNASGRSYDALLIRIIGLKYFFARQCIEVLCNTKEQQKQKERRSNIITWLYSERKMFFLALVHLLASLAIYQHYFYSKFRLLETTLDSAGPNYWLQRTVPPALYATKHAILFQMSLLPLTMARHTLAWLASSRLLSAVVPFERVVAMHIYLGYILCALVFACAGVFAGYFGFLCGEQRAGRQPRGPAGDAHYCTALSSEIFLTGVAMTAVLAAVAATSALRTRLPYEWFMAAHTLVMVMFALAAAHTMDDKWRQGRARSQDVNWFSASLALYIADRFFLGPPPPPFAIASWEALEDRLSSSHTRVLILRLAKPVSFLFSPGQFVHVCVPAVDGSWHPFSIGSAPLERSLDLYLEVFTPDSWTGRLWQMARDDPKLQMAVPEVRVKGPFGTEIDGFNDYRHIIAMGSGTGVVRMLSLTKTVCLQLCQLNKPTHQESTARLVALGRELKAAARQGEGTGPVLRRLRRCLARHLARPQPAAAAPPPGGCAGGRAREEALATMVQVAWRLRRLRAKGPRGATFRALACRQRRQQRRQAARAVSAALPALEFGLACLALSWHGHAAAWEQPSRHMARSLLALTAAANGLFVLFWAAVVEASSVEWWMDAAAAAGAGLALGLWSRGGYWGQFNAYQVAVYLAMAAYRAVRVGRFCFAPGENTAQLQALRTCPPLAPVDSFRLAFMTRNASLALHLWPELDALWRQLEAVHGSYAAKICTIEVCVTDKSKESCVALEAAVRHSALYAAGALKFERPDVHGILRGAAMGRLSEDFTIGKRCSVSPSSSATLVAFCGGQELGAAFHRQVVAVQAAALAIPGSGQHELHFTQESYGSSPARAVPRRPSALLAAASRTLRSIKAHMPSLKAPTASVPPLKQEDAPKKGTAAIIPASYVASPRAVALALAESGRFHALPPPPPLPCSSPTTWSVTVHPAAADDAPCLLHEPREQTQQREDRGKVVTWTYPLVEHAPALALRLDSPSGSAQRGSPVPCQPASVSPPAASPRGDATSAAPAGALQEPTYVGSAGVNPGARFVESLDRDMATAPSAHGPPMPIRTRPATRLPRVDSLTRKRAQWRSLLRGEHPGPEGGPPSPVALSSRAFQRQWSHGSSAGSSPRVCLSPRGEWALAVEEPPRGTPPRAPGARALSPFMLNPPSPLIRASGAGEAFDSALHG